MLKINITCLLTLIVLSGGLASCARDTKDRGAPKPPARSFAYAPPSLHRARGSIDLRNYRGGAEEEPFDLADTLDTTASRAKLVEVNTKCRGFAPLHTYFENENKIAIFRLLPEDMLTRDLGAEPVGCVFDINFGDGGVHRYGYSIFAPVTDVRAGDLSLELNGRPLDQPLDVVRGRVHDVQARYADPRPATATLICTDFRTRPEPFTSTLEFTRLNLHAPEVRGSNWEQISAERPEQRCRLLVRDATADPRHRRAVSPLFTLRLQHHPWRVRNVPLERREGLLTGGSTHVVAEYEVTNLEDQPRRLRFPRVEFMTDLEVHAANPQLTQSMPNSYGRLVVVDHMGTRAPAKIETIAPRATLRVRLHWRGHHAVSCAYSGVKMTIPETIFFEDVGAQGETLGSVAMPARPPAWVQRNKDIDLSAIPIIPATFCGWD